MKKELFNDASAERCERVDEDCTCSGQDIDDSVKYCPECETPNQFGDLCDACRRDLGREGLPT